MRAEMRGARVWLVVSRAVVPQVLAAQEGAAARAARVAPLVRVAPRVTDQLAGRAERPAALLQHWTYLGHKHL